MKDLKKMSIQELKTLKSEINKELTLRETLQTTCIWSVPSPGGKKKEEKTWEGEKYIS